MSDTNTAIPGSSVLVPAISLGLTGGSPSVDTLREAFRGSSQCALGQSWRGSLEPDFAPGTVRVARDGQSLLLLAEFVDHDIYSRATALNQRMWELGDTFEIFLQPEFREHYVEFHVTPNNQRLQLRFASPEETARVRKAGAFDECLIWENIFRSRTWLEPESSRWVAFAEIPSAAVGAEGELAGTRWKFSFSRYDYTRGRPEPVISSTSHLTQPDFHRVSEWGWLQF